MDHGMALYPCPGGHHWRMIGRRWEHLRKKHHIILLSFLVILTWTVCGCGEDDWPVGCPHGEVILPSVEDPDTPGAYFDFSAGEIVYGEEGRQRGDIYLDKKFIAGNPSLNVALHDAIADSLLYDCSAPGWGSTQWKRQPDEVTPARVPIYSGHNVWIRTGEGHTAKFKILFAEDGPDLDSYLWIRIRWIYQPDGTEEFHDVAGAVEGESADAGSG